MPRITINVGDFSGVKAAQGFNNYDGPTPPAGSYRIKTGLFRIVTNSSDDPMFKIVLEIAEPKSSEKAKYNGYAIWHNANITEKSAPFTNAMLDALGIDRKAVWAGADGGIVTFKEKPEDVKKIGTKLVKGLEALVTTKRAEYPPGSGQFKLEATSFAAAQAVDPDADPDADDAPAPDPDADEDAAAPSADDADDDAF